MKPLILVTMLVAGVSLAATAAEAAKKRKPVAGPHAAIAHSETNVVRDTDGEILGQDPDPFIRLMIRREGKVRDHSGR